MKLSVFPIFLFVAVVAPAQRESYSDDPVIIRDTDIAEGVEHTEPPKERDPAEAKKNIDVGNFYSKQENYVGAIGRYLTAMEYQPDLPKAYEAFERAYELLLKSLGDDADRSNKIAQAIGLIEEYLRSNPDPVRSEEFRVKIEKLRSEAAQATE